MKILCLMRHADAARAEPALGDRERPLSRHGAKAAAMIGAYIKTAGLTPDLVLCSDSRRTRETLVQINPFFLAEPAIRFAPDLYLANAGAILQCIREQGGGASRLLVIGHNPGLAQLAIDLSMSNQPAKAAPRTSGFPPATLIAFEADTPRWRTFQPAQTRFHSVVTPEDLTNDER